MLKESLILSVVMVLITMPLFGQDKASILSCEKPSKQPQDQVLDYCAFHEVDLGFMTISIPEKLQKKEKKCIEGGCWEYTDGVLTLSIDYDQAAWRPGIERTYSSYTEERLLVDNVKVLFWSFQDQSQKSMSGAVYATHRGRYVGLGIYLSSRAVDTRELGKKIFASVKFKPKT